LGWAVPAYLALAFVCLVLAVIDAATGLLPNRITYPAFPVVAGLLLAASLGLGELGRLGRGLLAAASVGGLFLVTTTSAEYSSWVPSRSTTTRVTVRPSGGVSSQVTWALVRQVHVGMAQGRLDADDMGVGLAVDQAGIAVEVA
jgi:prepilin signal peptidase PulO-like enzyme (type II secretory pathway)